EILEELDLEKKFTTAPLGAIKLRGKEKEIFLHSVTPVGVADDAAASAVPSQMQTHRKES
ncbi:MAG: hypothetical protein ABIO05_09410, partial [Ferruginibacter sp.]